MLGSSAFTGRSELNSRWNPLYFVLYRTYRAGDCMIDISSTSVYSGVDFNIYTGALTLPRTIPHGDIN